MERIMSAERAPLLVDSPPLGYGADPAAAAAAAAAAAECAWHTGRYVAFGRD